jgi:hypothetical protein
VVCFHGWIERRGEAIPWWWFVVNFALSIFGEGFLERFIIQEKK